MPGPSREDEQLAVLVALAQAQQAQVRLRALELEMKARAVQVMSDLAPEWPGPLWWQASNEAMAHGLQIDLKSLADELLAPAG